MNANYPRFIPRLFPNAKTIVDRFHIIQLLGRSLDQARLALIHGISDHHSRVYKVLKSQWRLFHMKCMDIDDKTPHYLFGINEYMTQQNALDLGFKDHPRFKQVYDVYQAIQQALSTGDERKLVNALNTYKHTGTEMDTAISTLKKNMIAIKNSCKYSYSNEPVEGKRRIMKYQSIVRQIDNCHEVFHIHWLVAYLFAV